MKRIVDEKYIARSIEIPPLDTRAAARSRIMYGLNNSGLASIDWDSHVRVIIM